MTRDDIIRMAREAGLGAPLCHGGGEPRIWIEGADWHDEVVSFAYKLIDAVDAKWLRGEAKVRIPTETMDAEFSNYHRLGYKAGAAAEREACAKVCEETDLVEYEHCMVLHIDGHATLRNAAAAIRERGEK